MVVVALVALMAVVGVAAFRRQVYASKTTEVADVVAAIRAAEEAFRAENQYYLDVSSADGWYPTDSYGEVALSFRREEASHDDQVAWETLNPRIDRPIQFRYLVNAGGPADAFPSLQIADPGWAVPNDPWYVVQARADYDNDGVFCNAVASSLNGELYIEREGE